MSVYRGFCKKDGTVTPVTVTKDGAILSPAASQKVWNHSPDGFQWGYGGSGPAQLALAICLDVTGDEHKAVVLHQHFKRDFVCGWGETWEITSEEVEDWIETRAKELLDRISEPLDQ